MRAFAIVLLAGCGADSNCPTVERLAGTDPAAQEEAKIVVARCTADHWSKDATDCFARAGSDAKAQEPCFKALTPAQQASLKKAFEPIAADLDRAQQRDVLGKLDRDIAALRLDDLVARAPACAEITTALQTARGILAKCARPDALQVYGLSQHATTQVRALRAITNAQDLETKCRELAKALTVYGDGCE
ncbi:MAG TPA: hypothetical protein VFQ53_36735 [Kofleriaceae bacterium]|nr:hypothetical protein [Kofleriaceae bacterium]